MVLGILSGSEYGRFPSKMYFNVIKLKNNTQWVPLESYYISPGALEQEHHPVLVKIELYFWQEKL